MGDDVPALLLDMDEVPILEEEELLDLLVTFAAFYDLTKIELKGKAMKRDHYMFDTLCSERRAPVIAALEDATMQFQSVKLS